MSWNDFWIILVTCGITMLICRVAPLFLLKGRELPGDVIQALNLIPPAAFAALVANDILAPGMFAEGLWPAGAVICAAIIVVVVAIKTKSLIWCAVAGVASYAILLLI